MFSRACEYGIKAVIVIAEQSMLGRNTSLKEVASRIDSPEAYTSKILQKLTHHGIIHSAKGPTGGYVLRSGELERVRLSHIVEAIDGDAVYMGCGLGLKSCNANKPCPLHAQFSAVREQLRKMLEQTRIESLSQEMMDGMTFLKR